VVIGLSFFRTVLAVAYQHRKHLTEKTTPVLRLFCQLMHLPESEDKHRQQVVLGILAALRLENFKPSEPEDIGAAFYALQSRLEEEWEEFAKEQELHDSLPWPTSNQYPEKTWPEWLVPLRQLPPHAWCSDIVLVPPSIFNQAGWEPPPYVCKVDMTTTLNVPYACNVSPADNLQDILQDLVTNSDLENKDVSFVDYMLEMASVYGFWKPPPHTQEDIPDKFSAARRHSFGHSAEKVLTLNKVADAMQNGITSNAPLLVNFLLRIKDWTYVLTDFAQWCRGHYVAFVLDGSGTWMRYNDGRRTTESVTSACTNAVENACFLVYKATEVCERRCLPLTFFTFAVDICS
jgi:hypothetical protein